MQLELHSALILLRSFFEKPMARVLHPTFNQECDIRKGGIVYILLAQVHL